MGLLNKKNIKNIEFDKNKFGITEKDLIGELKGFTLGIVVRMLEEQEKQGNIPDVKVFQEDIDANTGWGGFNWSNTKDEYDFWYNVINKKFYIFYKKYPEYKKYDK